MIKGKNLKFSLLLLALACFTTAINSIELDLISEKEAQMLIN